MQERKRPLRRVSCVGANKRPRSSCNPGGATAALARQLEDFLPSATAPEPILAHYPVSQNEDEKQTSLDDSAALITPWSSIVDLKNIELASDRTVESLLDSRSTTSLSDEEQVAPRTLVALFKQPPLLQPPLEHGVTFECDSPPIQSTAASFHIRKLRWPMSLVVGLVLLAGLKQMFSADSHVEKNSVYVPGAGFSGFWYTLGRLDSIKEKTSKNYYCYSAGCLGVVSALRNQTMEDIYSLASGIQRAWKNGEMSRYKVVETFVDGLLNENNGLPIDDPELLSRLNILTTVRSNGWWGTRSMSRSPSSIQSLRTMLMQTTWIPLATGNGLFYKQHMDGAFSVFHHPTCERKLGLVANVDLLLNVINVNLGPEKVMKLWKLGLETGL